MAISLLKKAVEKYIDSNYKTIEDIPASAIVKMNNKKMIENTKILIIDDDKLKLEDTLRRIGYNVVWKEDIDVLSDVEQYSIIVCDYKGVGLKFGDEFEGLNLVKLIKEKYPDKILYILSAADFNPRANECFKCADEIIYKGDERKLIDYISQDMKKIFDPRDKWKRYKTVLMQRGIKEKDVFRLEHLYVQSIIEKKDRLSNDPLFVKISSDLNINFDIKIGLVNIW